MAASPFYWSGSNGRTLSPDEVAKNRAIAAALASANASSPSNLGEGLTAVGRALAYNGLSGRAAEAEQSGQQAYSEKLAALGADPSMTDLMALMDDPWASKGGYAAASAMLGNEMDANDPYKALQLQQAQLDYEQDLAGDTGKPETYFGNGIPIQLPDGTIQYGQFGNQGGFNVPTLPAGAQFLSPVQQLNAGTQFMGVDKFGNPTGTSTPIDNAGAARDTAVGKGFGEMQLSTIEAGNAAAANNIKLDALEATLANAPQGAQGGLAQMAGAVGINIGGLDEIQASEALINSMVPLQRAPGSGTMSDADLDLFKKSLPRIINQPGGNARIINTLRALNTYTIEHAKIERSLASDQIDDATAMQLKGAIPNPLAAITSAAGGGGASQASPIPQAPTSPVKISGDDEFDALPAGALFIGPDGVTRRKQ